MKTSKNGITWVLVTTLILVATTASAHHGCRGMHRGFYGRGYHGGYYAPYQQVVPPPAYYAPPPPPPAYYAPPPPVCRPRVYAPRPHRGWRRFGW